MSHSLPPLNVRALAPEVLRLPIPGQGFVQQPLLAVRLAPSIQTGKEGYEGIASDEAGHGRPEGRAHRSRSCLVSLGATSCRAEVGFSKLRGNLHPQNVPSHVGPELFAGNKLTRLSGGTLQRRAVLCRKARAVRPEPWGDIAAVAESECGSQCGLSPEDPGCSQQRGFFGHEVRVHGPSLMSFDLDVKGNLTPRSDDLYGAHMDKPAPKKEPLDPVRRGIGQRLKTAREQKGMTQQEVATKFDVKKATVSAWETGAGAPDAVRLRRLARLYDVSADALLWDDSLTTEAMRFAAQFDALNDKQQRSFRAMWLAYFEEAVSDEGVEKSMPITTGRREDDPPYALPRPIKSDSREGQQHEASTHDRRKGAK